MLSPQLPLQEYASGLQFHTGEKHEKDDDARNRSYPAFDRWRLNPSTDGRTCTSAALLSA